MPDAVGNLFRTEDRKDREYGPAGQLLAARSERGTTHYRYEAEGNLVEKIEPDGKHWSYDWNSAGMLSKVLRPDGTEVRFEYDALGRRLKKTHGDRTTTWIWDGNNPLHEQSEGKVKAAPITWLFEPESFAPMAKIVDGSAYAITTDHLGTPVLMTDAQGEPVFSANISAYGQLRDLEGDRQACPFRWPGQYEDEETGLYYNRFRYYDPEAGQYASQDPIGLLGGVAAHGYVHDPLTWIDPLGLAKKCGDKNTVFRQLSAEDVANIKAGRPLKPKGSGGSIADHIGGEDTGHISASLTEGATDRFASKGGALAEIDVSKATKGGANFIDHNNVMGAAKRSGDSRAVRDARRAEEVLSRVMSRPTP